VPGDRPGLLLIHVRLLARQAIAVVLGSAGAGDRQYTRTCAHLPYPTAWAGSAGVTQR
jgi:hypothetical protein